MTIESEDTNYKFLNLRKMITSNICIISVINIKHSKAKLNYYSIPKKQTIINRLIWINLLNQIDCYIFILI